MCRLLPVLLPCRHFAAVPGPGPLPKLHELRSHCQANHLLYTTAPILTPFADYTASSRGAHDAHSRPLAICYPHLAQHPGHEPPPSGSGQDAITGIIHDHPAPQDSLDQDCRVTDRPPTDSSSPLGPCPDQVICLHIRSADERASLLHRCPA